MDGIFVHHTAIQNHNPRNHLPSLGAGETMEFDVVEGQKNMQASSVIGPQGAAVRGSRYVVEWGLSRCHPQERAPWRHLPQGHLTRDTEGSDNTWEGQAQPRWPQGCPRLPRCYLRRPYCHRRQESHTLVWGEQVDGAHGHGKQAPSAHATPGRRHPRPPAASQALPMQQTTQS